MSVCQANKIFPPGLCLLSSLPLPRADACHAVQARYSGPGCEGHGQKEDFRLLGNLFTLTSGAK